METIVKNWKYGILALVIAIIMLVFAIWLPNLSFMRSIIISPVFSISQKIGILLGSLKAFETNLTLLSQVNTLILSLLFGVNMSLVVYYLNQRIHLQKSAGLSVGGIFSGLIGIGCASCGSFIFTSIFGMSASAVFLARLPFQGQEFAFLGIAILAFAIVATIKKIKEPLICE